MSETVKLIIEIPKEDIELICKTSFTEDERTMFKQSPSDRQGTMMLFRLMDSVKDGKPLDEADSEDDTTSWEYDETHAWYECKKCGMSELWEAKFCPNCGRRAVSK